MDTVATQSLNAFDKYGLAGLVILALFALLVYVLMQIKTLISDHNARVNIIVDAHCEERGFWMQSLKDNTDALRKLVEQTTRCQTRAG
ncbi:MAG: hypothetical protein NTY50_03970 [Methylobacter sp.]|nr:hypothetical protein [Methylobacter sp.]